MNSPEEHEIIRNIVHQKLDGKSHSELRKTLANSNLDPDRMTALIKRGDSIYLEIVKYKALKSQASELVVYGIAAFILSNVFLILIAMGIIPLTIVDGFALLPLLGGFYVFQNNYSKYKNYSDLINQLQS